MFRVVSFDGPLLGVDDNQGECAFLRGFPAGWGLGPVSSSIHVAMVLWSYTRYGEWGIRSKGDHCSLVATKLLSGDSLGVDSHSFQPSFFAKTSGFPGCLMVS